MAANGGGMATETPNPKKQAIEDQKAINEEYKIWKKNTPFLYDVVMSHALEWPSLTVSWLPDYENVSSKSNPSADYTIQRLLIGTHAPDNETNFIHVVELRLPSEESEVDVSVYGGVSGMEQEYGGYGLMSGKVEIVQSIIHDGEVNRARYCPQKPSLICTKTSGPELLLFDRNNHTAKPPKGGTCQPELTLTGHDKEGFGLSWNNRIQGHILSGSEDRLICLWDVSANVSRSSSSSSSSTMAPLHKFRGHTDVVEDVAWSIANDHLFASCGDDKLILVWDTRTGEREGAITKIQAHTAEVNTVAFSPDPSAGHLLVSGSADRSLALWDLRTPSTRLHSFEAHKDAVLSVCWAPFSTTVLASCSADRRIHVWDAARIGLEQDADDAADGPPELIFIHGGHTDKVDDIAWSPHSPWTMASVADDNILQVWQIAEHIVSADDDLAPLPEQAVE